MNHQSEPFYRSEDFWSVIVAVIFFGGIGAWILFGAVIPYYHYSNASPSEKCQIDLEKRNDPDKFCDKKNVIQSKAEQLEKEAEKKEETRRAKLSPYERCVEDRENSSAYVYDEGDYDGGLVVCNKDGSSDYISESELEADITEDLYGGGDTNSSCHPSYSPCVNDVGYDLDCPDIGFGVSVIGYDEYRLDGDGDGYGCESY